MPQTIKIPVEKRPQVGKSTARKLRRSGHIPGIVYGPEVEPTPIALDPRPIVHLLETGAAENVLLEIETPDGDQWLCLLKDYQLDPVHHDVLHADFYAVKFGSMLTVRVPIHLAGEAPGVKQGGILEFHLRELTVECLPKDIPERIEVDLSELEIGDYIQVRDLQLPEGVRAIEEPDAVIVSITAGEEYEEETPEEEEEALLETPEPEVIRRGKAEEVEEEEA